jgi:hypothetical protein
MLTAPAAAAVEAVAGAAFKALAYRTSKRSVGDRHLAWQLAQHILLRSILSVSLTDRCETINLVLFIVMLDVSGCKSFSAFFRMDGRGCSRGGHHLCVNNSSAESTVSFLLRSTFLQGGFIKSFMDYVVPLVRDKSLLVSSEGIAAMTRHMCEKGNGNAAISWLLTCRGAGSSIDQR